MAIAYLGYEIDSSGAVVAEHNLDDMTAAAIRADRASDALSASTARVGRGFAGASVNMRMLVPQLSQIGQQYTATGQLGQALAVQAADIGLAFGVVGTVVGTLAGVGLPILISSLGGASSAADEMEDSLDRARNAMEAYQDATEIASMSTEELAEKFGSAGEALGSLYARLQEIRLRETARAMDELSTGMQELFATGGDGDRRALIADFFDLNIYLGRGRKEARLLTGEFLAAQDALSMADEIQDNIQRLDAQIAATERLLTAAEAVSAARGGVSSEEDKILTLLGRNLEEMQKQRGAISDATDEAGLLEGAIQAATNAGEVFAAIDFEGGLMDAAARARELLGEMVKLAQTANASNSYLENYKTVLAYQAYGQSRMDAPDTPVNRPTFSSGGSGGGGASRIDEFADNLERLRESLRTEREVVEEWYSENQEILANQRAVEILGIEGHNEAKLRLEEEYQERLKDIQDTNSNTLLGNLGSFFSDAEGLMSSGNKALFEIGKAAAIANATVNSVSAAEAAWEKGMQIGGPPVAAAFAGLSVLSSAARIAALKSATFGGGSASASSGGGGNVSGITAEATTSTQQLQRAIIQVSGNGKLSVDELNQITKHLQDESKDGVIIEGFTRG